MRTARSSGRPVGGGGCFSTSPPGPGTPPLTESQTPVKTLPCPNFVEGGKKVKSTTDKNRLNNVTSKEGLKCKKNLIIIECSERYVP